MEIQAKELLRWKDELIAVYERHTGQSKEKLRADMERDNFMTPDQAVAYGLADKVESQRHTD